MKFCDNSITKQLNSASKAQNMSHLRFLPTRWNGVDIEKYKFTSKPQLREYQNAQFVGSVCLQSRKRTTSEPGLWTQARDTSYIPGHSLRAGCFPEKPKRENARFRLAEKATEVHLYERYFRGFRLLMHEKSFIFSLSSSE
ncbi:uncharacterized protein LOC111263120 isoform X3 [Varroa jacobsoni]|uniref:uncharacterized protein LOC111263120 isoform X3 n=1 Tax=Varroa jacobsoni TaxID=62625 RepID=UPI000BF8AE0E|nr:uncharacterized protein LOC111263120 isoform X3 [Varroa jacobsoni]